MILSDRKIRGLRYFWYFRVSIEVRLECLLRGLKDQVAILTVSDVTLNHLGDTWRKPAL